jgi:filamentous hemagglutinin family protein
MATGSSKLFTAASAVVIFGLIGGASAEVATDGTVGPRMRLGGPEFDIRADLGTRAGRNLFHSFERFSLASGERATFSGPDEIRNVLSRVTGDELSYIDGTIASTIPGADFFFINPAGVTVRAECHPGRPRLVPHQHGRRAAFFGRRRVQRDQSVRILAHGRRTRGVRLSRRRSGRDHGRPQHARGG